MWSAPATVPEDAGQAVCHLPAAKQHRLPARPNLTEFPAFMNKKSIRKAVKSLAKAVVLPPCKHHQPWVKLVPGTGIITENGYAISFGCPNCSFGGMMHPSAFEDLFKEGPPEVIDILKKEKTWD